MTDCTCSVIEKDDGYERAQCSRDCPIHGTDGMGIDGFEFWTTPSTSELLTLHDNYQRGAIDIVTFQNAMDDLWKGIPNSYAQAPYDANADGGEPTWPDEPGVLDRGIGAMTLLVMIVLVCLGATALILVVL